MKWVVNLESGGVLTVYLTRKSKTRRASFARKDVDPKSLYVEGLE